MLFLDLDGRPFSATDPDIDAPTVERIAAGEAPREDVERWLRATT